MRWCISPLGSGLSATYNNCRLAAAEMPGVYAVDSRSLSTGSGLAVLEAADRIAAGMPAEQVAREVQGADRPLPCQLCHRHPGIPVQGRALLRPGHAGGQSAAAQALYRGQSSRRFDERGEKIPRFSDKALSQYVRDKLEGCADLKTDRVFITHSGISQERIDMVRDLVKQYADFKEIYVTRAGCTISPTVGPIPLASSS